MGDTARESEDGDQALGSVQGTSQKSTQSNFDGADTEEARASHASSQHDGAYGKYNVGASHTFKEARKPNSDEKKDYQAIKSVVNKDVKELKKIIEKRLKIKRMQIVINITEDFVRNSFVFILKSSLACFIKKGKNHKSSTLHSNC